MRLQVISKATERLLHQIDTARDGEATGWPVAIP